jgi:hypothetical protein
VPIVLRWNDNKLYHLTTPVAEVVPDTHHPKMWRVKLPHQPLTDMVNYSRVREAAFLLAMAQLDRKRVANHACRRPGHACNDVLTNWQISEPMW